MKLKISNSIWKNEIDGSNLFLGRPYTYISHKKKPADKNKYRCVAAYFQKTKPLILNEFEVSKLCLKFKTLQKIVL